MIIKQRTLPIRIQQNQALLRRLPKGHKKRPEIEQDLAKRLTGYRGEQNVDYHLEFLPQKEFDIFHDLRLLSPRPFQIDTLLISEKFALILEIKNISGTLTYDQYSHQLIRKINEGEEGFQNPILQVKRQHQQLIEWLNSQKVNQLPIEYLVVISHASTILKTIGSTQIFKRIIHADRLIDRIIEMNQQYEKTNLPSKDRRKISKSLLKHHSPLSVDVLQLYQIPKEELIVGIQCPTCQQYKLIRVSGKWYCPSCKTTTKNAHKQAIMDFLLLINPTISNKQCRDFLCIESRSLVSKLLAAMALSFSGQNKTKVYYLPKMNTSRPFMKN